MTTTNQSSSTLCSPPPYLYWQGALSLVFILTLLRGIRLPSSWSFTFYLFNYDAGFVKRGLTGALVALFDCPPLYSYSFFVALSALVLLINSVLLNVLLWRLVRSHDRALQASAFVFASTLAIVYLGHLIGFDDHFGLLVILIGLLLRGFYPTLIWLALAFVVVQLNHEAMLVIFYPVAFLMLLLRITAAHRAFQWCLLIALSAALISMTFYLSTHPMPRDDVRQMREQIETRIETDTQRAAFIQLHRDNRTTLDKNWRNWQRKGKGLEYLNSVLVFFPAMAMLLWLTLGIQKRQKRHAILRWLTVAAVLSPQLLHIIAWDMHRWNGWSLVVSFLLLSLFYASPTIAELNEDEFYCAEFDCSEFVALATPPASLTNTQIFLPICLVLIVIHAMATVPLLDRYQVSSFPYLNLQQSLMQWINGVPPARPKR